MKWISLFRRYDGTVVGTWMTWRGKQDLEDAKPLLAIAGITRSVGGPGRVENSAPPLPPPLSPRTTCSTQSAPGIIGYSREERGENVNGEPAGWRGSETLLRGNGDLDDQCAVLDTDVLLEAPCKKSPEKSTC